jgi:CRISPR-associated endonuclease Cas3-HD
MRFFAHSRAGMTEEFWEPLEEHLRLTAEGGNAIDVRALSANACPGELPRDAARALSGATGFAAAFHAAAWGRLLGWWHDLGKYSVEFQDRLLVANGLEAHLESRPGKVDHSTAGARRAIERFGPIVGKLLAYCITGHHGGLPDGVQDETGGEHIHVLGSQ